VILSTHIVEDVRELCPRMAIIAKGTVLLEGSPAESLDSLHGKVWSKVAASDDELKTIEANLQVLSTHLISGQHEVRVYSDADPGDGFKSSESELEDVYFLSLARHAKN
jgi:ABC-2 type transport system ATP-binding protein